VRGQVSAQGLVPAAKSYGYALSLDAAKAAFQAGNEASEHTATRQLYPTPDVSGLGRLVQVVPAGNSASVPQGLHASKRMGPIPTSYGQKIETSVVSNDVTGVILLHKNGVSGVFSTVLIF
jgi:hypothetical protein